MALCRVCRAAPELSNPLGAAAIVGASKTLARQAGVRVDRAIWFLAVAQAIVWAGMYYLFPALLVRWEADLGWSKTELTGAMMTAVAASAVLSPVAGRLIDKGHGRAVLVGSAAAGGVLVGLLSVVETRWQFHGIWALIGAAMAGCLYEPCFALVTRARGAEARWAITRITLVAGFAGTLSFPTAHAVSEALGWRAAALTFAALILVLAVPLAWAGATLLEAPSRGRPETAPDERVGGVHAYLRRPEFWLLAAGFSLMALDHGIVLNHLLPLLHERAVTAETAVLAAAMVGPMQVAGRVVMVLVERRVTSHAITITSFLGVSGAAACLLGAAAVPVLLVAFVVLQGGCYGVTSIMKPVVSRDLLGQRNFGAITGALALPYLAAFALAPFLGSLLWEAGTYDFVLKTVFAMSLAGLAAYLAAVQVNRRRARLRIADTAPRP
jgi:MFS family permease